MAVLDDQLKKSTRRLVGIALILTLIGLVFIYSASSIYALEKFGSAHYFFKKQLFFLIPSFIAFLFFALMPLDLLKKYAPWLFLGSLGLTLLTFVPYFGIKVHGSNRWLRLGGIAFQPSEFLKLFLFMYIGFFLEKKQKSIRSFMYGYIPFLAVLGITFLILLKQPDFGSVITIFSTSLILFFVAEFRMIHLLMTLAFMVPAVVYLIVAKAYRLNRILIFLNPWSDSQGRGFQIIQSLIALGSGNFWGLGISNSKQKFFYLPMQHTDFIFPIIGEETGFIGSIIMIMLYFLFCFYGLRIALCLKNQFAFFTTLGFVVFISLQAVINIMVTAGLLPTKGLGLPFVSYGGTALVCLASMIGFIVNSAPSARS